MKNPEHIIAFDASVIAPREMLIDDPAAVENDNPVRIGHLLIG